MCVCIYIYIHIYYVSLSLSIYIYIYMYTYTHMKEMVLSSVYVSAARCPISVLFLWAGACQL